MKALFLASALFLSSGIANAAFIQSHYIQSCQSWTYHSHQGASPGYLCGFMGQSLNVPDAQSVDMTVDALERKIMELERRIQQLEKKNP